eukprot:g947.t1
MGADISMQSEMEGAIIFDEGEFEKTWKKTGLANESMWSFFQSSYEELTTNLLRPMSENGKHGRAFYKEALLGPRTFELCGTEFQRTDFEITNNRKLNIVCSHWDVKEAGQAADSKKRRPCVVYLHSTVGSRVEALQALIPSLRAGCSFLAFDFSGSGMSGGEYVTWGWFENNDVVDIVQHLNKKMGIKKIALWGRNLGAATAILYASKDKRIKALILDTPYATFEQTLQEGVKYAARVGVTVPRIVMSAAHAMIVRAIRNRVSPKFDIKRLKPMVSAKKCKCPALFAASLRDIYITQKQVESVFNAYAGSKSYTITDIRYFDARSYRNCGDFLSTAENFLSGAFKIVGSAGKLPVSTSPGSPLNPYHLQETDFKWVLENARQCYYDQPQTKKAETSTEQLKEEQGPHQDDDGEEVRAAIEEIEKLNSNVVIQTEGLKRGGDNGTVEDLEEEIIDIIV